MKQEEVAIQIYCALIAKGQVLPGRDTKGTIQRCMEVAAEVIGSLEVKPEVKPLAVEETPAPATPPKKAPAKKANSAKKGLLNRKSASKKEK